MKKNSILILLSFILLLTSCSREKGTSVEEKDSFDRKEMTTFWAKDFIIPALENFKTKSTTLNNDVNDFATTPNATNLAKMRESLHKTYIAYQYIGFFQFGKAEQTNMNYQFRLNTYPTNIDNIVAFAEAQDYEFRIPSKIADGQISQGLPAVDYMINGFASDDEGIINRFTTDTHAADYKAYLKALTNEMLISTNEVLTDWNTGYKDSFIENQSNNAAGSLSLVVNTFVSYYEKYLRAGKIGYPAGILTPMYLSQSNNPKPELVESYYSNQHNKEYALEGLKAMTNFFNGVSFDENKTGKSLKHYIEYLDAKQNNQQIAEKINTNFADSKSKINLLQPSFVNQINTDIQPMKDAYNSLQSNVLYLKVNMPQVLNVTISYMDTDGD